MKSHEKKHKRCLGIIHDEYESDYETLLEMSGKPVKEIKRIKPLAIEIFKTVNSPDFMKNIFITKQNTTVWSYDLIVRASCNSCNPLIVTLTCSRKSLLILGPKLWNALPTKK